jgi:hypothetical protein
LEQFHETGVVVHHQHTHALYLALPVAPGAEEDLQDVQRPSSRRIELPARPAGRGGRIRHLARQHIQRRRVDRPDGDPIVYRVVLLPWTLPEVDARTYVDELCDRSV